MTARPGPLPAGLGRAALVAAVREGLAGVADGASAIVALSGGPDSTALAYLATEARPDLDVTLVHVRHGLRDDREDLAVVERHADFLGLPLEVVEVAVRRRGHGIEAAAREARYGALREIAAAAGATAVLVGHSAEDQAETVLLRAARGTGVTGLAAMSPDAGGVVRPLLRVRRGDLRRFVALEGLPVAADPSNTDPAVRRVAVRDQVLPALDLVAPDPVGALGRLAALAADDEEALASLAADALTGAAVRIGDVVAVPDAAVAQLPVAVRRRVWRQLLTPASGHPPSSAILAELEALAPGRRLLVGQIEVSAGGGWLAFGPPRVDDVPPVRLTVPGVSAWPLAAVEVRACTAAGSGHPGAPPGQIAFELSGAWTPPVPARADLAVPPGGRPERCHLTLAAGTGPLTIRRRRPGDRCRTAAGTRRVAELLVDAKVPRPVRDRWPLLVADGRVLWVPGVAADADALAAGRAAPAVQLVLAPAQPR
ncbi:tRNA lysidine(34) synthetase TilS [Nitriliruptor alkaliphilus]|uniref:tRNA lysidine(34) synthetase TilS n=1 Tax=Nitriliruptor alkaliphilus TaxID=427918 RepID=UPI000B2DE8B5|nr:tRNA lysidine(34) synthetase TilS [Nitriliruptor alkaliphilus]